jgi:hypothetical protein
MFLGTVHVMCCSSCGEYWIGTVLDDSERRALEYIVLFYSKYQHPLLNQAERIIAKAAMGDEEASSIPDARSPQQASDDRDTSEATPSPPQSPSNDGTKEELQANGPSGTEPETGKD